MLLLMAIRHKETNDLHESSQLILLYITNELKYMSQAEIIVPCIVTDSTDDIYTLFIQ